ncbi:MAG: hypothetical protein WBF90_33705 [Rivularia sp. (in: cyanobacteria)]
MNATQEKLIVATQQLYGELLNASEFGKAMSVADGLKSLIEGYQILDLVDSNRKFQDQITNQIQTKVSGGALGVYREVQQPEVEVQQPSQSTSQITSTYAWGDGWKGKEDVSSVPNPWKQ